MSSLLKLFRRETIVVAVIMSGVLALLCVLPAAGTAGQEDLPVVNDTNQNKERLIKKQPFPGEPVKITRVKTKNGVVEPEKIFSDGDDDWFKGLTIRVENVSDKPINYVSLLVVILRPKEQEAAGKIPFGESLRYGVSPFQSQGSVSSKPIQVIPPGGSTELALSDASFEENKGVLKKLGFPRSIRHIELSVQDVGFEDGTAWSGGELWHRDPTNPDRWIPLVRPDKWILLRRIHNGGPPERPPSNFIAAASGITKPERAIFFTQSILDIPSTAAGW